MEIIQRIKIFWTRITTYHWAIYLFIFLPPAYRWDSPIQVLITPDGTAITRYLIDALMGWILVEIILHVKGDNTKKRKRTYNKKATT